jgi:hypothetical protein
VRYTEIFLIGGNVFHLAGGEDDMTLEDFGGARLLVSDVRVVLLLLDEARCRGSRLMASADLPSSAPPSPTVRLVTVSDRDALGLRDAYTPARSIAPYDRVSSVGGDSLWLHSLRRSRPQDRQGQLAGRGQHTVNGDRNGGHLQPPVGTGRYSAMSDPDAFRMYVAYAGRHAVSIWLPSDTQCGRDGRL